MPRIIFQKDDMLLSGSDEILNDFEVSKKPKADLVLGLPWLWLYEAKIDVRKEGIRIYGDFVPFCKYLSKPKISSDSETDSSESSSSEGSSDSEHAKLNVQVSKKLHKES